MNVRYEGFENATRTSWYRSEGSPHSESLSYLSESMRGWYLAGEYLYLEIKDDNGNFER
jgi:hypothetical protein